MVEADASLAGLAAMASRDVGGVMTRALAGGGLQISLPLTIRTEQLTELATGLRAGLDVGRGMDSPSTSAVVPTSDREVVGCPVLNSPGTICRPRMATPSV